MLIRRTSIFVVLGLAAACMPTRKADVPDGFVCSGHTCARPDAGTVDTTSAPDVGVASEVGDAFDAGVADAGTSSDVPDLGATDGPSVDTSSDRSLDATSFDAAMEVAPPPLVLTIAASASYTNSKVTITVNVTPTAPVSLYKATTLLTTLTSGDGGSLTYEWDTTSEPEGSYQVTASAQLGADSKTTAPVTVVVDRTAPTVVSATPFNGATNVPIADPIILTFSESLAPSTVSSSSVSLVTGSVSIPSTTVLSADGKTLTIAPSSAIAPGPITATLDSHVADAAGNKPILTWSWTYPAWVVYGPIISMATYAPGLVVDANGRPIVATTERDLNKTSQFNLRITPAISGGRWDQPIPSPLNSSLNGLGLEPFLAYAQGKAILAWSADNTSYVSRRSTEMWAPWPTLPSTAPLSGFSSNAQGDPIIAWTSDGSINPAGAYLARWSSTSASWEPLYTNGPIAQLGASYLQMDPQGQPAFVADSLYRYLAGSWVNIPWPTGTSELDHDFAFDGSSRPIAATTNGTLLQLLRYDANAWQPWGPTLDIGNASPKRFNIEYGAGGAVVAFGVGTGITVARLSTSATWDVLATVPTIAGSSAEPLHLTLRLDQAGKPVLAFHQFLLGDGQYRTSVVQSNR